MRESPPSYAVHGKGGFGVMWAENPPKILDVGSARVVTAALYSAVTLTCAAEGNRTQRLPVAAAAAGAPQVVREGAPAAVWVARGQDATLRLVVCADPRPRSAAWEWGSLRLEAGSSLGKYRADELQQDSRDDCFVAALHVTGAGPGDARRYSLLVENERGADRFGLQLAVREPVDMATLLSAAAGSVLVLLLLVLAAVWAVRREKCCFALTSNCMIVDKFCDRE
ncbi:Irregular chiasm C-roughest protein-like Protein [Gryllus bimaculatus]|nr:Irregular chiasm C-roughest protein-like Protein [Gryllus bimaculatus]